MGLIICWEKVMPELSFRIDKRELHAATDGDIIYLTFIEKLLCARHLYKRQTCIHI